MWWICCSIFLDWPRSLSMSRRTQCVQHMSTTLSPSSTSVHCGWTPVALHKNWRNEKYTLVYRIVHCMLLSQVWQGMVGLVGGAVTPVPSPNEAKQGLGRPRPCKEALQPFLTSSGFWSRKIIVIVWVWFEQPLHIYSLSVPYTLWCKERVHKKIQPNLPLTQFCSWDFILPHLLSIASEFTLSFWRCQLPPPRPGSMVAKTASTFQPPDSTFLSLWPEAAHANNATSKTIQDNITT